MNTDGHAPLSHFGKRRRGFKGDTFCLACVNRAPDWTVFGSSSFAICFAKNDDGVERASTETNRNVCQAAYISLIFNKSIIPPQV